MADEGIIKKFLVALGFKTDEEALKKFVGGIEKATFRVGALAAGVEAMAFSVAVGVARVANNLEQLYFAAQRTGDSATELQAFDLAARRMGASAGTGMDAVKSLAAYFRNIPGGAAHSIIDSLFGLGTVDKDEDKLKTLLNISEKMQHMDYFLAKSFGNQIGLSDDQVWVLRQKDFAATYQKLLAGLHGSGLDKAADDAHRFENSLADLEVRLEAFGARVIDVLQNKFKVNLDSISSWLDKNGDRLTTEIVEGLQTFIHWAEILAGWLKTIYDWLVKLDSATDGWSTKILAAVVALRLLGGGAIISGIISLAAAVVRLGAGLAGLALGPAVARGLGGLALATGTGVGLGYLLDKYFPNNWLAQAGEWVGGKVADATDYAGKAYSAQKRVPQFEAMHALMKMGWSQQNAAGLVANLQAESGLEPHKADSLTGTHYGIAQWDQSRQKDFEKWAGYSLHDDRADVQKQLEFMNYELTQGKESHAGDMIRAAQAANLSGFAASHYYERHGIESEDVRRSREAGSLYQETVIHVHGANDPAEAARRVAAEQDRVNRVSAVLIREFAATVQ